MSIVKALVKFGLAKKAFNFISRKVRDRRRRTASGARGARRPE